MTEHSAALRRGMALALALVLFFGYWVTPISAYAAETTDPSAETTAPTTGETTTETTAPQESTPETTAPEETTTETTAPEETTTETTVPEETTTETTVPEETTTETTVPEETTTETTAPEETTPETTVPEETEEELTEEELMALQGGISLMSLLPETVVDSGQIEGTAEGDELYWQVTRTEEGVYTLTITGEGAIPNYTDATRNYQPWRAVLGSNSYKLVLGEGVTKVGQYAFRGTNVTSIQFSSTVTSVGYHAFSNSGRLTSLTIPSTLTALGNNAFQYCTALTSIVIPGTLKTVPYYCFQNCTSLTSITLEEGVTTVDTCAFATGGHITNIHIPASLTSIGTAAFQYNESYTVAEGNSTFTAVEGVLYTITMKTLVDYPKYRAADVYEVPDTVTTLKNDSLRNIRARVGKIVIPASVQTCSDMNLIYASSGVKELYIEDGALAGKTYGGLNCTSLVSLRLPENTKLGLGNTLQNCTGLRSFTIPNGTTSISYLSNTTLTYLGEIIYDAANAQFTSTSTFVSGTSFDLTIGPNVENLQSTFSYLTAYAKHIYFTPNTQFTIQEGAFDAFGEPLASVSGNAWVDAQGCLYIYDTEAGTAKLVYCPPDVTSITVPAAISIPAPTEEDPDNAIACTVDSVCQYALSCAEDLTAITFTTPGNILTLEAYALGNCPTLTSVNGKTSVSEALASFTNENISIGWNVLLNTGLTDAEINTDFGTTMTGDATLSYTASDTEMMLSVSSVGETGVWQASGEGSTTGGYHLLTGDTVTFTAVAENKEDSSGSSYCRIYLRLTDSTGSLNITPGGTYTFNNCTATCYSTQDPLTVYLEFQMNPGDTISVPVQASYPAPGSGGGGVTVWGVILDETQKGANQNKVVDPPADSTLQAYWDTKREIYKTTKAYKNSARNILGDTATGEIVLNDDLEWYINCIRQDAAATYGRDPVEYIDYTDTFTLPEGITLKEEVIAGLNDSTKFTWSGSSVYVNGIRVYEIYLNGYSGSNTGTLRLMNAKLQYDDETRTITMNWRVKNISTTSAQMPSFTTVFKLAKQGLDIDPDAYLEGNDNALTVALTNEVDASLHYRYSSVDTQSATAAGYKLSMTKGSIAMNKTVTETPTYFGEDISYRIYLQNAGATPYVNSDSSGNPYTGEYTVTDQLQVETYIKPENMEKMFQEEYGKYLTITISNAELAPYEQVTDIYGGTSYRTTGNSDLPGVSTDQTLTVTLAENGTDYVVTVGENQYQASTAAAALQAAGYAVTASAQYTCAWLANPDTDSEDTESEETESEGTESEGIESEGTESDAGNTMVLSSGERREYYIYATVKDTFTLLDDTDWRISYPESTTLTINNNAKLMRDGTSQIAVTNTTSVKNVRFEAWVDKSGGVVGGGDFSEDDVPSVKDGNMMEYTLYLTHYGEGVYEDLPLVDDIYGSQYLLVSQAKNPSLAGLREYGDYYVLTTGEYTNVVLGKDEYGNDCIAASITVTENAENVWLVTDMDTKVNHYASGIHTRIKWYYSELKDTGAYETTITYNTLVDAADKAEFSLDNIVFVNDKVGTRIWESVGGQFTKLDLKKDIVVERGETAEEDTLEEDQLTTVEPGSSVTYRLMLQNESTATMSLTGEKIADALPSTGGVFNWEKGVNVTIEAAPGSEDKITGLDDWYLAATYQDFKETTGQQYIRWPKETEFHFVGDEEVYLYVTLTYPSDDTWDAYCAALKGDPITNKLYIHKQNSMVTHYLADPGEVLLQKGVYAVTYDKGNYWNLTYTPSRSLYQNTDTSNRRVVYYATLYNGAAKRLYLNDMVDYLPKGFTYLYLCGKPNVQANDTKNAISITTIGGLSSSTTTRMVTSYGTEVTYRSAKVTAQNSGGRNVTFKFDAGSGDYAVKYDETVGKYYLDQGEAIVFGYACTVGSRTNTEDIATNTLSMAYTDYNGTGVNLVPKEKEYFQGTDVSKVTTAAIVPHDQNDGDNLLLTASEAEAQGIQISGDSETYLASTVSVSRGGIQPGISKAAVSYTPINSSTAVSYENVVSPTDTVKWTVTMNNDGTYPMYEYTVTDCLPYPYVFKGNVILKVYTADGALRNTYTLFSVPEHDHSVTQIKLSDSNNWLVTYGTLRDLGNWAVLMERVEVNGKQCEQMSIRMDAAGYAIPEGGYVELTFDSYNPTTSYENTVYTNHATLTPNASQPFTMASQGSIVRDESDNPVSVTASAPINVSFGYATSAVKRVTENTETGASNTAASTDDKNYIYIPDAESTFTYSLTVQNDSGKAMSKLVLINNLPEVDDHSPFDTTAWRGSEFKVKFADTPNVTVTVTTKDGTVTTLDPSSYTVQYQEGTTFTDADWDGTSTGWTTDPTTARSIRVVILDDDASDGEVIPEDASVTVSFNAEIEGKAEEDQIAWSSFGYHYGLRGIPAGLEAMPLAVGVKIGKPPTLQKELKTYWDEEFAAEEDTTFQLLVYTGDPLTEEYASDAELEAALTAADRDYQQFAVTVKVGETKSEVVPLTDDTTNWRWKTGQKYTIVELDTGNEFSFDSFNVQTFTYDPGDPEEILCQNLMMRWSIDLTKVGEESKPLENAVFALYSPNQEEQKEDTYYMTLAANSDQPDSTITDDDGTVWYLKEVKTSNSEGKIVFENLYEDQYKLIEVRAPEGYYNTHKKGQIITRDGDAEDGTEDGVASITLINKKLLVMPETGGSGAYVPMLAGILIMLAAGFLLLLRKREDARP